VRAHISRRCWTRRLVLSSALSRKPGNFPGFLPAWDFSRPVVMGLANSQSAQLPRRSGRLPRPLHKGSPPGAACSFGLTSWYDSSSPFPRKIGGVAWGLLAGVDEGEGVPVGLAARDAEAAKPYLAALFASLQMLESGLVVFARGESGQQGHLRRGV
jgi:hypothetical protein